MESSNQFLIVLLSVFIIHGCAQKAPAEFIAVNLAGYQMDDNKEAFLVNAQASTFEVVNSLYGDIVYTGTAKEHYQSDPASGDEVTILDFTVLDSPGLYFIRVKEPIPYLSETFEIAADPYSDATLKAIQSYYYHRCGTKVENSTPWSYQICHLEDAPFYGNIERRKEVTGGWHDAGDYNKFSVNTSFSVAMLLYLYESDPAKFLDGQLNIPENNNGIPDILDETKWALDWLLKMQDSNGGVFHKVSQKKWVGEFLPTNDPTQRYIFNVSSAATASFAATTALASQMYVDFDPIFAQELERASIRAWKYLQQNPIDIPLGGFENPKDVQGGEYGDNDDLDERMWASLELFKLTSDEKYLRYYTGNFWKISKNKIQPLSWRNVSSIILNGFYNLDTGSKLGSLKESAGSLIIAHADALLKVQAKNNYKNLVKHTEYYWGSNSVGLAYAYDLIKAYEITGQEHYKTGALDQLHFVMGRNPFNLSQITGVGTRAVRYPYHQLSEKDGVVEPVPGMLVGGPNNHTHLRGNEISPFPAKNYEDEFKNYLVNEVAINYTAVFAYVSGYFSSPSNHNILTKN